jgi:MFS family permease
LRNANTDLTMTTTTQRSNVPSLTCAFLASLASGGNTYAFGIYGAELKKNLSLSQGKLDTISTAFFVAGLLSSLPGWCVDRYGTRLSFILSGIFSATFLSLYWAVAKRLIDLPQSLVVPVLSLLGVLCFMSNSLAIGAVFKTVISTAGRGNTGTAVGAAKGFVGLGSGTYACLFGLIKRPNQASLDFLLMVAFFAIFCVTLPAIFLLPGNKQLRSLTFKDETTPWHFRVLYTSLFAMASVIVSHVILELYSSKVDDGLNTNNRGSDYVKAGFLLLIWLAPMVGLLFLPRSDRGILIESAGGPSKCSQPVKSDDRSDQYEDAVYQPESFSDQSEDTEAGEGSPLLIDKLRSFPFQRNTEYNLVQMLQTTTAGLMLWTSTILVGAGLVITNNMGQMAEALDFNSNVVTPASLALFSVAQAGARVATGSVSEAALEWNTEHFNGVPRTLFFVLASILSVVAHGILSMATDEIPFVIGVALAGLAFGMVWPLLVLVIGEVFGTNNLGANYMFFDGFTCAVGSLLLSKMVAQDVYENHIEVDGANTDRFTCYGTGCFRQTHVIVTLLSLTCVAASLGAFYSSRPAYRTLTYDRQSTRAYYK